MATHMDYKFSQIKETPNGTTAVVKVYEGEYQDIENEVSGEMENVYVRTKKVDEFTVNTKDLDLVKAELHKKIHAENDKDKGKRYPISEQNGTFKPKIVEEDVKPEQV
jgi:hypothetical protein